MSEGIKESNSNSKTLTVEHLWFFLSSEPGGHTVRAMIAGGLWGDGGL